MRTSLRVAALAVLVFVASCGGGGGGDPGLLGVWTFVSGPAFSGPEISDEDSPTTPRYLQFEADGSVTLIRQEETSQVVFCTHGVYTTAEGSLFVQLDLRFSQPTFVFLRDEAGLALTLTDSSGSETTLARVPSLPAAFRCNTLVQRSRHDGLSEIPLFFSGLAWDGVTLLFTTDDYQIVPIDRSTGTIGLPLFFGFDQYRVVHAAQGTDLWVDCACGHGQQVQRKTQAGVLLDSIDTLTDLGEELNVHAIAFDPSNAVLWIQGGSFSLQRGRIMKISSDFEPDVLVSTVDFDVRLRSWTWDGTWLWAVTLEQNVVRIDPVTLDAVESFETPDRHVQWVGIASAPATSGGGTSLFLIGEDDFTEEGVLIEVQP